MSMAFGHWKAVVLEDVGPGGPEAGAGGEGLGSRVLLLPSRDPSLSGTHSSRQHPGVRCTLTAQPSPSDPANSLVQLRQGWNFPEGILL